LDTSLESKKRKTPESSVERKLHYHVVEVSQLANYIGRPVIIYTDFTDHRGLLKSVDATEIKIKKNLRGGNVLMGIPKNKIEKAEVYSL
jgi:hypothetical protein